MSRPASTVTLRKRLIAHLFPFGIPSLWCPLLTHYDNEGEIDHERMAAHLTHLSPHIKGYLIPGSTGDGWELTGNEVRRVVEIGLAEAVRLNLHVLIGVLKTGRKEAAASILETMAWLRREIGVHNDEAVLATARIRGFTVCPPKGKDLSQEEIGDDLEGVLRTGLPIALYQLPQITENEMDPELVYRLAERYANFILFKDTSGEDRIAHAGLNFGGVFLVRGAEGGYAGWLTTGGGPYHGLLLSTANCFARQYHEIHECQKAGLLDEAKEVSKQVSAMTSDAFKLVANVKDGNPFANANKAMDHYFAFGPKAATVTPPRLHAGVPLPKSVIRATGEALTRHGLMPAKGYLQ